MVKGQQHPAVTGVVAFRIGFDRPFGNNGVAVTEGQEPQRLPVTHPAELTSVFNADIASLVAEVTDDKSLDKAVRKKLQVEHPAAKSERAKIIKLADKTSNLRSLVKSPPENWEPKRRQEYLNWALEVARGLRGTNAWLEAQFDEAAERLAASCAGDHRS